MIKYSLFIKIRKYKTRNNYYDYYRYVITNTYYEACRYLKSAFVYGSIQYYKINTIEEEK